jgi:hypothetical protein
MAKGPLQEAIEKQDAEEAAKNASFPGKGQPALFANQFYVLVGAGWSRLSFGEQVRDETPAFHASFTMPTAMAKDMAETILRIIAEQQPIWDAENQATKSEET